MHLTAELIEALSEWHRLSELEGEAIIKRNWPAVAEQQGRKSQLQGAIQLAMASRQNGALDGFKPGSPTGSDARVTVDELIALEQRNARLIGEARKSRLADSDRLSRSLRDLHGVRRAYAADLRPHWQSYS